jgi:hypothetical protein
VGFKYQKGYDWLDSKFNCSYLESRGVPEKNRGEYGGKTREMFSLLFPVPVTLFPVMQLPVAHAHAITSLDATSGDDPPQMRCELCLYTTNIYALLF